MSAPVSRIASVVGYPDPLYFSRVFKDVNGVSPSEFRERSRLEAAGPHDGSASGVVAFSRAGVGDGAG